MCFDVGLDGPRLPLERTAAPSPPTTDHCASDPAASGAPPTRVLRRARARIRTAGARWCGGSLARWSLLVHEAFGFAANCLALPLAAAWLAPGGTPGRSTALTLIGVAAAALLVWLRAIARQRPPRGTFPVIIGDACTCFLGGAAQVYALLTIVLTVGSNASGGLKAIELVLGAALTVSIAVYSAKRLLQLNGLEDEEGVLSQGITAHRARAAQTVIRAPRSRPVEGAPPSSGADPTISALLAAIDWPQLEEIHGTTAAAVWHRAARACTDGSAAWLEDTRHLRWEIVMGIRDAVKTTAQDSRHETNARAWETLQGAQRLRTGVERFPDLAPLAAAIAHMTIVCTDAARATPVTLSSLLQRFSWAVEHRANAAERAALVAAARHSALPLVREWNTAATPVGETPGPAQDNAPLCMAIAAPPPDPTAVPAEGVPDTMSPATAQRVVRAPAVVGTLSEAP